MSGLSPADLESLLELFEHEGWRQMRVTASGVDLFVSQDPSARIGAPRRPGRGGGVPCPAAAAADPAHAIAAPKTEAERGPH